MRKQDIVSIQKKWESIGIDKIRNDGQLRMQFYNDYRIFFSRPCLSCMDKLPLYYSKLINTKSEIMEEREFELHEDAVLHIRELSPGHITNANLTDDIAEKMLKMSPGHAKFFKRMPEGYLDQEPKTSKKKTVKSNGNPNGESFRDELIALSGIGEKTADTIIGEYATKPELVAAIQNSSVVSFNPRVDKVLLEAYGE